MSSDTIGQNLVTIGQRIHRAALACGRTPDSVRMVAVAKTQNSDTVRLAIQAGATIIGENYLQESTEKFDDLIDTDAQWHFIGHLQRNKAKQVVRMFDLIHSVDSEKLAVELDKQAEKIGKVQDLLIQVNIAGEDTKSGVSQDEAMALVKRVGHLPHVRIKGLMTMPPFFDQPEKARPYFASLCQLKKRIESEDMVGVEMAELSMGMTGDFEVAIEEGATLVRIGTALFGARQ